MSRLMKRFVSLLLVLTMLFSMASVPVFADEGTDSEHDHEHEQVITISEDTALQVTEPENNETDDTPVTPPAEQPTEPVSDQNDAPANDEGGSDAAPEAGSDVTPEAGSDAAPEAGSDVTPEAGSDVTPEAGSDAAPEAGSDVTPEDGSDVTPEDGSDVTPEDGSDVTPEDGSDVTPEDGSDVTPEDSSDVTPEDGSDVTPDGEEGEQENEGLNSATNSEPDVVVPENTEEPEEEKELDAVDKMRALIDEIMAKYVAAMLRAEKPELTEDESFEAATEKLTAEEIEELLRLMSEDEELVLAFYEDLAKVEKAKEKLSETQIRNIFRFYHNFDAFVEAAGIVFGVDIYGDVEREENKEENIEETPDAGNEGEEGEKLASEGEAAETVSTETEADPVIPDQTTETEPTPVEAEKEASETEPTPVEPEKEASETEPTPVEAEKEASETEPTPVEPEKEASETEPTPVEPEIPVVDDPVTLPSYQPVVEDDDDSTRLMIEEAVDIFFWDYFAPDASSIEEVIEITNALSEAQIIEIVNAMDEETFEYVCYDISVIKDACDSMLTPEDAALVMEHGVFEYVCAAADARVKASEATVVEPTPVEPEEETVTLESLRAEIAEFIAYYGLTPDMPDAVLLQVYDNLPDFDAAEESIAKINAMEKKGMLLSVEEQNILLSEENSQLCLRYREVVKKAYFPTTLEQITKTLTYNVADDKIQVSVTANKSQAANDATLSDDKTNITIKAKGYEKTTGSGCNASTTTEASKITIKIKNNSGLYARISFDYAQTNAASFTIAGNTITNDNANYASDENELLVPDEEIVLILTTKADLETECKLVLSNFHIDATDKNFDVKIAYDAELGSVTAGDTAISNDTTLSVSYSEGCKFVATPNSGATFYGWVNYATGEILSTTTELTINPTDAITIRPIFTSDNALFRIKKTHLFDDLNLAIAQATIGNDKTIVVANDGVLPAGDYTIPSGITLLIPYNDSDTLNTTAPSTQKDLAYSVPTAYRTLTMAEGANITVNGAISLSAMTTSAGGQSSPVGKTSFIKMQSGSSITVNNGGNLYAWGFIQGSGSVTVKSGGTVYECFQVADWRGGTVTESMVGNSGKVFPFSQYYVQNIEVPLTLEAGAIENGYMSVQITLFGIKGSNVPFIGPSGLFNVTSGYIIKDYNEANGRLEIDVHGGLAVKTIRVSMQIVGITSTTIDSSEYVLPINGNMTIRMHSGSSVSMTADIALLPGAKLIINSGATASLGAGKKIFIYDYDEWVRKDESGKALAEDPSFCGSSGYEYVNLSYPSSMAYNVSSRKTDACVQVNGYADLSQGYAYTTAGGGHICGSGTIKLRPGTDTKTYQAISTGSDDKSWTTVEIPITSAKLLNSGDTYTITAIGTKPSGQYLFNEDALTMDEFEIESGSTYEYKYKNGKWMIQCNKTDAENPIHYYSVTAKDDPTCGKGGSIVYNCQCGSEAKVSFDVPATGNHTREEIPAVPATCMESGLTAGVKCSVCNTVLEAQVEIQPSMDYCDWKVIESQEADCYNAGYKKEQCARCGLGRNATIDALGHDLKEETIAPTCEEDGYTLKTCSRCDYNLKDNYVDALQHDYESTVTYPTCTTGGYTTYTCKNTGCGDTFTSDEVAPLQHNYEPYVTEPTCTEKGYTTYTCKNDATHTYVDENSYKDALGHNSDEKVSGTPATCYSTGLTDGTKCSRCHEWQEEQQVIGTVPHSPEAAVEENKNAATCSEEGSYDSVVYCSVAECHFEISRETKTIEKLPHTPGTPEKKNEVAATCTKDGSYDLVTPCTVCTGVYSTEHKTIPALTHDWGKAGTGTVVTEPTCSEEGTETVTCQRADCGETKNIKLPVNPDNHKYNPEVTNPTCYAKGYTTYTCEWCQDDYVDPDSYTDEIDHTSGDPVRENVVDSTCYAEGSYDEVVRCSVEACKAEISREKKTIEKKNHTAGAAVRENVVDSTCYAEGSYDEVVKCANAGCTYEISREKKTIEKKNHTAGAAVRENVVDSTCYAEGSYDEVVRCSVEECKEEISREKKTIEKKTHTAGAAVRENVVDSTCYAEGSYDEVVRCSVEACKEVISSTPKTIAKKAHTPGDPVSENVKDSTCYAEGSYDEVVRCSVEACKEVISSTPKTIAKKAHTPGDPVSENVKDSTCYAEGSYEAVIYCSVAECNHRISSTTETIAKKAHTPDAPVREDVVDSTCYEEGSYNAVVYCSVAECHHKISSTPATIEKKAHTPAEAKQENVKAATCYKEGSYDEVIYCSVEACKDEIDRKTITTEKKAHTPGEIEVEHYVDSTCYAKGSYDEVVYCAVEACHEELSRVSVEVELKDHVAAEAVEENKVDSTCYAEGSYDEVVKCANAGCTHEISRTKKTIEKTEHHMVDDIVTLEPKCEVTGLKTMKCDNEGCTYTEENVEVAALDHQLEDKGYVAPTCTQPGEAAHSVCVRPGCGYETEHETFEPLNHDFEKGTVVEDESYDSTCSEDGQLTKKCVRCDEKQTTVIECTGHKDLIVLDAVAATCYSTGLTEGEYCKACDTTTKEQTVVPEAPHTPAKAKRENEVAATCYEEGSYDEVVYCSVEACKDEISRTVKTIEKLDHTPASAVQEDVVAATCYKEGSYNEVVRCSVEECKEIITSTPRKTNKIAHTPGEAKRENEVAATCYKEGSYDEVVYCAVEACGANLGSTSRTIDKIPHTPADAVREDIVEATCYAKGSYKAVVYCSVKECNHKISTTTEEIEKIAHTPAEAKQENVKAATCYEEGSYDEVIYCSVEACKHQIDRKTITTDKTNHTPGEIEVEHYVDSTCYAKGSYDEVVYCAVEACHEELSRVSFEVELKDHVAAEAVEENKVDSTCYAEGSYDEVVKCANAGCTHVISRTKKTIEMTEHHMVDDVITFAPKCEETGLKTMKCDNEGCTYTEENVEVAALDHQLESESYVAPTCTQPGEAVHSVCVRPGCGYETEHETFEPLNHDFEKGTVVEDESYDSTCSEDGQLTKKCVRCDEKQTTVIECTGHKDLIVLDAVAATCYSTGLTEGEYCKACDTTTKEQTVVPEAPHTPAKAKRENEVAATCYEEGSYDEVVKCANAGCTYEISRVKKSIEKLNHTPASAVQENVVAATCYKEGSYDEVVRCSVEACKEVISSTPKTIAKKAHTPGDPVSENVKDSTCYAEGSYEAVIYCSVAECNHRISSTTETIGKKAHTPDDPVRENVVDSTCYEEGSYNAVVYCSVAECHHKISSTPATIEKKTHTPAEAKQENVKAATCYKEGSYDEVIYCSVEACKHQIDRKTITTEKKAHTPGEIEVEHYVDSTCYAKGSYDEVVYCAVEACHEELSRVSVEVELKDHVAAEAVEENKVDSTCYAEGSYDEVVKCANAGCTHVISRTKKTIEMTEHHMVDDVVTLEPKCEVTGLKTMKCDNEGCTYTEENVEVAALDHQLEDKGYVAPTCTQPGEAAHSVCVRPGCGYETEHEIFEPLNHDFEKGTVVEDESYDSTCSEDGQLTKKCVRCDEKQTTVIECTGHKDLIVLDAVAATCYSTGLTEGEHCKACDTTTKEQTVVPEAPHTAAKAKRENEVAATCYKEGSYDEVVYCSVEACKDEISRTVKTIEKLDHTPASAVQEDVVAATCYKEGSYNEVVRCSVEECKEIITSTPRKTDKIAHTPGEAKRENEVAATCYKEGSYNEVVYCAVEACGANLGSTSKTIDKLPHTPDDAVREDVVEATCYAEGSYNAVVYCSVKECNHKISTTSEKIEKIAHKPNAAIIENEVAATCYAEGSYDEVIYCSVEACKHEIDRKTITTDKTNHTPGEIEVENFVASTCYAKGSYDDVVYCAVEACHEELSRAPVEIALKDHVAAEAVEENKVDSTCYAEGSYDEVVKCANAGCTHVISRRQKTIAVKEHTPAEAIRENVVLSTCYKEGSYDAVVYCSVEACEYEIDRTPMTIATIDHTPAEAVIEVVTASTCISRGTGNEVVYCAVEECKHKISSKPVSLELAEHTPGEPTMAGVIEATCEKDGSYYEHIRCTVAACNELISSTPKTIPATGHKYEGKVTKQPTCVEPGVETFTCVNANCNHSYTEPIDELGHDYKSTVTPPTCSANGYTTYTCANDPKHTYDDDIVPALGHTNAEAIIENEVAATCTTDGSYDTVVYCKVETCKAEISRVTTIVDATGHSNAEPVEENRVAASCSAAGSYDIVVYCQTCGSTVSRETKTIDKLPHTPAEAVKENEVAVKCETNGSYDMAVYCSVCDEELSRETTQIPYEGHKYEQTVTAPTCTEKGFTTNTCSACGHSYTSNTKPQTGHKYGDPVVTKAATCLENGVSTATCENGCGKTRESSIPATGHNYEAVVTDPTCSLQGYTTHTCTGCGNSYNDTYVNSLGHTIVVDEAKAPTCTETGLKEGKHCSVCNEVLLAQEVIDALGHTEVIDVAVEPTCTEVGYKEGKHCSVCNEVLVAQEVVDALNHDEVIDDAVAATCTETGLTEGKHCLRCGEITVAQEVVSANGHNIIIDDAVIPDDCVTTGLSEGQHCDVCDAVLVPQVETPAGHIYVIENGVVTIEPDCYTLGSVTVTCERGCGTTEKKELPLKHQEKVLEAVAPTCTETGLSEGKQCELCDVVTVKQVTVEPLGHTPEVVPGYSETCEEDGRTDGKKCSVCGETLLEQEIIKAKHIYEFAPCVEDNLPVECTRCGLVITEAIEHNMAPATCTLPSTCIYCGLTEGKKLGHTEVVIEEVPATCETAAMTSGIECSVCGETIIAPVEDGEPLGHDMVTFDAKRPTYTAVGWEAYEKCARCGKDTYEEIPMLKAPDVRSYDEFMTWLPELEKLAYDYVRQNPGKDPVMLVIKYIRTGVDRYNSGSWGIMAGYEDAGFAKFVAEYEDAYNCVREDESEWIKISALKNIYNFTLPNGDKTDFGHMFGTMDITYHNNGSVNHADVGGWAGDLVDLLSTVDRHKVYEMGDDLEAMVKEISDNHLCKSHAGESDQFSQTDMYGDLDAFYVMKSLDTVNYNTGDMTALMKAYFNEDLTDADRAAFLLKNRLGGVSLRNDIRDAVYNAYTGNKVIGTLEGTRDFNCTESDGLDMMRKASCYAFADYLCRLAGDYVDMVDQSYYTVFSSTSSTLAPGITQKVNYATTADNKQIVYYLATADVNREDVNVIVNYNSRYPEYWKMERVIDQAHNAQALYTDEESDLYIENFNAIVSINAGGYDMSNGDPGGLLVMHGQQYKPFSNVGFFAMLKNGRAVIGMDEGDWNSIKSQVDEAIGGFGTVLVKDGKIAITASSDYYTNRAPRSAVGITGSGKVVFLVLDGRQEPFSAGGSMEEIAQIMFEAGCVDAINLDGGGSSTFVSRQEGSDELEVINRPSDGYSRSVSTSLLMYSTAPSSTAFERAVITSDYNYLTKGSSIQMSASAVSATGNTVEMPEGIKWAVSDETIGSVSEDGVFTAAKIGDVDVYLMLDNKVVGSKTLHVVTPDQLYFTKTNIDGVYGAKTKLPLKALYENKEVVFNENDVVFTLGNPDAGSMEGMNFIGSSEKGIRSVKITAALAENENVTASITVTLYNQGENSFDFDQATGGDRMLAWDREVSNSTTDDGITYTVVDLDKDMVTSYIIALDMTAIPIPEQLADLTYMLPGADVEGASAWTFLLQLAERVSVLTEVTPVINFDKNFDIDVSEIKLINDYFTLNKVVVDKENNQVKLTLKWKDQTAAIDPSTANPLCIVNGIKLTPKADAAWDSKDSLTAVNTGTISYTIYLRANALYSFSQKEENQKTFGLYPFVNPDLPSEKGGYFHDVYANFNDTYTLINALRNGWYNEDGGYAYYVDGKRMTGISKVEDVYYDFGTKGINVGKTPYTGLFYDEDAKVYRYSRLGALQTDWVFIEGSWYYLENYAAVSGTKTIDYVTFEFEKDGRLTRGVWIKTSKGIKHCYGPDYYYNGWQMIEGTWYYFEESFVLTGYQFIRTIDNGRIRRWFKFDENGALIGALDHGIHDINGSLHYILGEGETMGALHKYGDDYYFSLNNGMLIVNQVYFAWETNCDLPKDEYEFGPDGKMLQGFIEKDDGLYYYIDGKGGRKYGLIKIGDDYYFSLMNGKLITNQRYYAWETQCDLPMGTYQFGPDGKMVNPPIKGWTTVTGGYAYYSNGKRLTGIQKVDGYYYDFGENGVNADKTKYTGTMENSSGKTIYIFEGLIVCEKGHTEVFLPMVPATCTESGLTEGRYCSVCTTVFAEQTVIEALGHAGEWIVITKPTAETEGLKERRCTRCLETLRTETIPTIGSRYPGDVNDDGSVDLYDLLRLAKYVGGYDVEIHYGNSTVNGDDAVDLYDLLRLAKYVGGYDVVLE